MNEMWITALGRSLPAHAAVVAKLAAAVEPVDIWRSLVVGCSLGAGRGDRFSDIDAGVAYAESLPAEDLDASALAVLDEPPADVVEARLCREAREWVMLAWWAVSDIAKYLERHETSGRHGSRLTIRHAWVSR